jgi:hypothetical protein
MEMGSKMRLLPLAAAIAVAGCSMKETPKVATADSTAATTAATTAPNVVNITASEYKFEMPDQIPAGLTKFVLNDAGKEIHHASIIKLDSGKTYDDFVNAVKAMKPGTAPAGWVVPEGGPNAVAPQGSTSITTVMDPGNYAIVCWVPDAKGIPHLMSGMGKALTVTPNATANTTEPASDVTLTLKDYQFDLSTPLTAGKHTIKIETAPGQPHELTLFMLMPGKKASDVTKFIETGMKGPPPAMPLGGVAGVASGHPSFFDVDLKPGNYALICFLEDAKDGKPHYMHGMTQEITIS